MLTRVARWLAVMNGVPSVAIGSCEKVPPLCVTVIADCASSKVAAEKTLWQGYRSLWLDSEDATYMVALSAILYMVALSAAECNHVGGGTGRWPWQRRCVTKNSAD